MCGICGLVSLDGAAVDPDVLAAMNETLYHRGPDSSGAFVEGNVGLAARRLSIIDLAGGDQPVGNEDGRIQVVQNGEIYNHAELRTRLERAGHRFATRSDTEVLVHLYEERGPAFVEDLRGMFAIALWDRLERRLVLARDRFGIKPLYYRVAGGELSFASELKALLRQPGFSHDVDLDAVEAYLAFNSIPAPLTIFAEARKLPPGHMLLWEGGEPALRRYARPRPAAAGRERGEDERSLADELRERLRDSVRAHLVSDVPVGVLLSGGIDSSALAALAARESSYQVSTFSIGFEERAFNELDQARLVAEHYGTDHHELMVRPDAVELLPKLAEAFDEPFADSSALPTYLVSQLASDTVKVALSGEGGDELFGGYYTYVADNLAPRFGRVASALRPLVDVLPSSSGKVSFDYKAKRFARAAHLPPLERHHGWKEIFTADARAELLDGRRGAIDPLEVYRARYAETEGTDELARLQDVDIGIYLADDLLVKTDRASMAHSLEARVPFCDQVVAELALALPRRMKVRGLSKKRLLRQAVATLLPERIARAPKRGFSIPAAAWLRGDLEPFAREMLSPDRLTAQGFFDAAAVTRLIDAHVARREDLSRQIWGLLMFSLWHERYGSQVPGETPRSEYCELMPSVSDAILAFFLALLVVWIATPVVKSLAWRIGAIDEPRERGLHQLPTARLGGLAIWAGIVAAGLVWLPSNQQTNGILAGATVIVAVGIADDLLDLSADVKLAGQVLAAVVPVAAGVRVETMTLPFLGHIDLGEASYPLTVVGIVAVMNIVNFIDGVDGLAAGVCTIAAGTFAVIALSLDRNEAGVLAMLTAGAALGYLRHGFHPASIFLGDSGSNLLGYMLAAIAVQGALKTNAVVALVFPLVILAVPILDSSFVIAKRIKYGRPVYLADRWHFHHRFANIGFSQRRTVLYLYGWTLVLAMLALALRFVPYSDDHGNFDVGWSLVIGGFFLAAAAASVYLVLVLEILKLKRFRQFQIRRLHALRGEPPPEAGEVEASVAHELETGEFEVIRPPDQ